MIVNQKDLMRIREENKNKKIAFCSGCFDILHSGHVVFFKQCKEIADILVVGIGRDKNITEIKGKGRPINPEQNRAFLVSSLRDVDYIILNDIVMVEGKIDFYCILRDLKPDFFILNDDDSAIPQKQRLCTFLGITLKLVPRDLPKELMPMSSSRIIKEAGL